jgi:hypothetical protein
MKAKPFRLANRTFHNSTGGWIRIEWVHGNDISYNCSGSVQWGGGRLRCSRSKMIRLLTTAGYTKATNNV